ncbi:uncharacterized protein LOC132273957 isoform X2 [Cornus florida]|uniref:uncharacterized protein LOC132273957 isoform X2 n=1 Tax=Cornus florida TaxID=4283 RepID=UPI0028977293|nr:uncharacterized protein LOC132273957 isoform X2 [Cornus florida]
MEGGGEIRSTSELDDDDGAEVNDSDFALNRRDEDGDDIAGEDEDEDGDGAYTFEFNGDMDPLAFTEDDACGVQPYEQFERMEHEYEALAEKKRKALAEHPPPPHRFKTLRFDSSWVQTIHLVGGGWQGGSPTKKSRLEDGVGASFEEIMEAMNFGTRRKSRKVKKRGRRKGSKNKLSPEVSQKLGDATLHYAHGRYEEAICLLKEVVLLSPNSPDPYHTLGLVYNAIGDRKKALNFYMLAAHLTPKDPSLWKLLVTWSIEQGNTGQARYCLSKAITADPEDVSLKFNRASLYVELGDNQKAAESYEQISRLCPENIEALKTAVMFYKKCGQHERSVSVLEYHLKHHPNEANFSVVDLLAAICMEENAHIKALQHIEHARLVLCAGKELPLLLRIKEGICYVHLGHMERAEAIFSILQRENVFDNHNLITAVADSLISLGHYESALKYYMILEGNGEADNGFLHLKIAQCNLFLNERLRAIEHFRKALHTLQDNVDARITLASLLLDEDKEDEAIFVLSPPCSESTLDPNSDKSVPWWLNGKIKLKLCQIYKAKGLQEAFIDAILPLVRESLFLQTFRQKVGVRKRLSRSVLFERVKVLDDHQVDNVFHGFRPVASTSDLSKAARAKKLLQKKATLKEARKAAALVAGINWKSDDSDDDSPQMLKKIPLPNLLKDEEHYCLIIDLCKALAFSQRYWEALEIINLTLKLAYNTLVVEKKEELRSLGAQMAYNTTDPTHGWDCARYIVNQHPYSFAAWNCYYKVISRLESRCSKKHNKFLHVMRVRHKDCIPPIVIFGHQLTMISQHQAAAREYLEAYKLMKDCPLINLCVGTALINLALGLRLQNKHQCMLQGLAFLYNGLLLSENSQEAIYNIARAYHHVGLVTLAASYYEKVLAIHEKDYPIPKLPNENPDLLNSQKPAYCDLRREAAYNLHLIYKNSGAFDLARQVLKDHCAL